MLKEQERQRKNISRIFLATAFILLIPLIAMQFTDEVKWDVFDFAIIGALLIGTGLIYELFARNMKNSRQRLVLGLVLAVILFLAWAELAVGLFETPFAGS